MHNADERNNNKNFPCPKKINTIKYKSGDKCDPIEPSNRAENADQTDTSIVIGSAILEEK